MPRLQVFDPPMCCSTGVCGPSVDPALTAFAADVDWLIQRGVAVERFNLSQSPDKFASDTRVTQELSSGGTAVLPLLIADDRVVGRGAYPTREELASLFGLAVEQAPTGATTGSLPVMNSGCCGTSGCC